MVTCGGLRKCITTLPCACSLPQARIVAFGLLGPEPSLRTVRTRSGGIIGNHLAAKNPLSAGKMSRLANDARGRRGAGILRLQRPGLILHGPIHVPDAQVAVRVVEYGRSAGFAGRFGLAPIQLDLLPRIPCDGRDAHPNAGRAVRRIPLLDLVGEGFARAGA